MKQTAVEWLIEQLENHNGVTREAFENVIQQAKEMEKEQIVSAFEHVDFNLDDGLHYYEQTYESKTNI